MSTLAARHNSQMSAIGQATNYNGIDLIKFLCALMVFVIHIPPFSKEAFGAAKQIDFIVRHCLCRIAVPFFFVSTGFFLFRKMPLYEPDGEKIKAYCFKLLRLLGIWRILLVRGTTGHLWYLGATVVAVIFLTVCLRHRMKLLCLCVLACLLYTIGLLDDSYAGLIAPLKNVSLIKYADLGYHYIFSTTRNGLFMGFVFVLMGATFAHRSINIKLWLSAVGLAVSMLFLLVEAVLLKTFDIPIEYNMYVSLIPAVFFLFSLAKNISLKNRPIYKHLRSIGFLIYLCHIMICEFVCQVINYLSPEFGTGAAVWRFGLTLIATLLLTIGIEWLSCKKKFTWLRWLVS